MQAQKCPAARNDRGGGPRQPAGFTLVELLVVIGIIIVLIGILLPVVANVRKKGYSTSTSQQLGRIGTACQAYYADFHSYPGPLPEKNLDGDVNLAAINPAITGMTKLTSSQNLVLGLLGGLFLPNGTTPIKFDPKQVTQGAQNLSTLNPKQYNAYLDVTPDELPNLNGTYTSYNTVRGIAPAGYVVPEFLDHIPIDPPPYHLPILYMRARTGAGGIVVTKAPATPYNPVSPAQYTFAQVGMYQSLIANAPFTSVLATDYPVPNPNPPTGAPNGIAYQPETVYFANPGLITQPRGKDSFILISAGSDNTYGTADDIIYSQ